MRTVSYNPSVRFPFFPGTYTVRRKIDRPSAVRLTDQQYRQLAAIITEKLSFGEDTDDILFGNRFYVFTCKTDKTDRKVYTGVEFLGMRESYIETEITLKSLVLESVYSLNGNELKTDIDCRKLEALISDSIPEGLRPHRDIGGTKEIHRQRRRDP